MQDSKKQRSDKPQDTRDNARLQAVIRQIRRDAEDNASQYLRETRVPAGGE